jgi:ABC-2 type transport system permease protein
MRLHLRLDRVRLGLLVYGVAAFAAMICSSLDKLYPHAADRQSFAADMASNSAIRALYGPVYGSSVGALTAWRSGGMAAIVGLIAIFMVVRHTRADEESGRRELLGATVVGRQAPLVSTLVVVLIANVVMAVAIALALIALGQPAAGSFAFGAAFGSVGWVFAGVAAVTAQLTVSSRTANGLAVVVWGVAIALRMAGNAADSGHGGPVPWPAWLSPIGWSDQVRPYTGNHWWVLGLAVATTGVLTVAALALSARRDVGAGVLPTRLGPPTAAPWLRTPLALAWRLQWGSLLGWTAGLALFGGLLGAVAKSAADVVADNPDLADVIRRMGGSGTIADAFVAGSMGFLGLAAAACAIQAALRVRSEETSQRAEAVLSTAVPRLRWSASHLVFAFVGPAVALFASGLALGVSYGLSVHDVSGQLPRMLAGALVQLPAVWVIAGAATLLIGAWPRWSAAAWGVLVGTVVIAFVGDLVDNGRWLLDLSPFSHVPKLPAADFTALPVVVLMLLAAALTVTGQSTFRHRDIG